MMKIIVWFTQDLRLNDQPALSAALKDGSEVYCTYIFDPANPEGPQAPRALVAAPQPCKAC